MFAPTAVMALRAPNTLFGKAAVTVFCVDFAAVI